MCGRTDTTLHGGREAGTVRRRLYLPSTRRSSGYDALTPRLDTPFSKATGQRLAVADPQTDHVSMGRGHTSATPETISPWFVVICRMVYKA